MFIQKSKLEALIAEYTKQADKQWELADGFKETGDGESYHYHLGVYSGFAQMVNELKKLL